MLFIITRSNVVVVVPSLMKPRTFGGKLRLHDQVPSTEASARVIHRLCRSYCKGTSSGPL